MRQLVRGGRAEDRRDREGPLHGEGQRHVHRVEPVALRKIEIGVDGGEDAVGLAPAEICRCDPSGCPRVPRRPGTCRSAGPRPAGNRPEASPARSPPVRQDRCHRGGRAANIRSGWIAPAAGPRPRRSAAIAPLPQALSFDSAKWRIFSFIHSRLRGVQDLQHVGPRGRAVLGGGVVAPVLPEMVGAAVGPVDLVDVDHIGPQPRERGVEGRR